MEDNSIRSQAAYSENATSDHKRVALQFLELVAAGKIDDAYQRYVASNGKHHNPFFRAGFPALREAMKENAGQFPDMRLTIKRVIGDGDLVATHSHVVMHPGENGMAVVHLFRFREGKIIEFWDCGQPVPDDSPNVDGMF